MKKSLLIISIILAQISMGDFDARIQYRQPRYQRPASHHHQFKPKVSKKVSVDEPKRRTFVSALLMAEIEFLEGLVADQQREAAGQKGKQRPGAHVRPVHKVKYQRPHHPVRKPATPPKKYVSKLDPFRMLDAPDLSKEAPKAPGYSAPVTEAPKATGYKAPVTKAPSDTTTTVKYGELEHYNLGGYLPPAPANPPSYQLPPVTSAPYAPPPPPPPPPQYAEPAPASYHQPIVQAPAYTAPVQAPAYEAPVQAPSYSAPVPPPYEAPVQAPAYEAPVQAPSYEAPVQAPSYEAPVEAPSYEAPVKANTNPHPHTFFHEAQAEKVHDGEWPTVYYNTFQGNQKTLIL